MADEIVTLKMTADDSMRLAKVMEWHGITKSAALRMGLNAEYRAVLAREAGKASSSERAGLKAQEDFAAGKKPWTRYMDEVKKERLLAGLPPLPYEALFAAGEARRAGRTEAKPTR